MKLRILPILLLLGLLTFGPTQSDPTQAYNLHQQTLADASQPHPTPALPTDTPAKTAKSVSTPTAQSAQDEQAETPRITQGPVPTGTASATTLNAALKIETGATSIGPAFEQFLEQAGAVVESPDRREAAELDIVQQVSQRVVAGQSQVDSAYGRFDLTRLRLENLLPASTLHAASLDGKSSAETVDISGQLNLGASGVIPDETAKTLAAQKPAPKLWPVKGPVTSTFGARPTLIIPSTTESAAGKGGAATGQTITLPAITPTSNPTVSPAPATKPITPTATTPAKPATTPTSPTSTHASQATSTPTAQATITPTTTAEAGLTPLPVTAPSTTGTMPGVTPTPAEKSTPPAPNNGPVTITPAPTATVSPTISATATVSPTVTPTPTPFPTGPIPLINGSLPAVEAGQEFHTGLDIAVPEGTEVHATADGVVIYAGNGGGYGRVVFIQHADGFMTVYGHNSKLLVTQGQNVKAGQIISLSGSTGYSTGPHVHYEVRFKGKIANPAYFLGLKS